MFGAIPPLIVEAAAIYAFVGAAVAIAFIFAGLDRVDPAARMAYAFRPLLMPGLILLWPVIAWRWWRLAQAPRA